MSLQASHICESQKMRFHLFLKRATASNRLSVYCRLGPCFRRWQAHVSLSFYRCLCSHSLLSDNNLATLPSGLFDGVTSLEQL